MKFYKYINGQSQEDIEKIKNALAKRCKPFLQEFEAPIYRGYKKGIQGHITRKATRKDRKPRFIPEDVHEELDKLLYDMYGWYPRSNGVFTGSPDLARQFTSSVVKVYMFFPVGKYRYIWTDQYRDLYNLYDELTKLFRLGQELEDGYKEIKQKLFEKIKSNIYHTDRLNWIVKNNKSYEAIFDCESFYLVDTDIFIEEEIEKFMKEF